MLKIRLLVLAALCAVGTGVALAQLPYNTALTQSHYNNSSVVITKQTANWDSGIRLGTTSGWSPGNWNEKYVIIALDRTSIPDRLTFRYKCTSVIATNPNWYVAESADNSNWSTIWSAVTPTSSSVSVSTDWITADAVTLSKSTRYIKLCYSGNYSGIYADIRVSDQAYVNSPKVGDEEITTLDFGAGAISSGKAEKKFEIEWCNVNTLSVTCDNTAFFTVSPASFGAKTRYGTQEITVTYDRDKEVGAHSANLTVTNGTQTRTVALSGSTTKRSQAIHWNAALTALNYTMNVEESLTGDAVATADNEDAALTYVSSDEEVIAVSPDGQTLYAYGNGTATVTATASGNAIYDEATDAKLFTVTSKKKQTVTWDQDLLGLRTTDAQMTVELNAEATSGGVVTYAIEGGSAACITLGGDNNAVLTVTGTPGEAYIIATQAGGLIGDEEWIAASYRKQVKVRDPNSSCDEYALADRSFTFAKGHKTSFSVQEYTLVGKPTRLTFTAVAGSTQYLWSEREAIYVEQYANFGSGLEWHLLATLTLSESSKNYGPYNLDESATKIRFRSGDYSEQNVSNISVPRKKELLVSETSITEEAERNVRWSRQIAVSRSNIDVVDISVESSHPDCPFGLSRASIGTDCADHSTETFEVFITPHAKGTTYTGTVTITDGKATPATHTIDLSITAIAFNQSILDFELPEQALTTDEITFHATATSGLEVVYLSSDSTVAYVEDGRLVILSAGTVDITACQPGDDRYNAASLTRTVTLSRTPVLLHSLPSASEIVLGRPLADAVLSGGEASVEGAFAWLWPDTVPQEEGEYLFPVRFTPTDSLIYLSQTADVTVRVVALPPPTTYGAYEAAFCRGDSIEYAGRWYSQPAEEDVLLTEKNSLGGDSVVRLTVTVYPTYMHVDTLSFPLGMSPEWQGLSLGHLPEGDTVLTVTYASVHQCDSVCVLHLSVTPMVTTYGNDTLRLCAGERAVYEGKTYRRATTDSVLLSRRNRFGGDSIVALVVYVYPTMRVQNAMTIHHGDSVTWQGYDLSGVGSGDTTLTAAYTSVYGCDSLYILDLHVLGDETAIEQVEEAQDTAAQKFFRNGQLYIRKNRRLYNLQGIKLKEEY